MLSRLVQIVSSVWRLPVVFVVLAACLYPLGLWLILRLQSASPLMLTVALAAVGACLICGRPLASLGWHWGDWRSQYLSFLLPLGYAAIAYLALWLLGGGGWYNQAFVDELRTSYMLESWSDGSVIALRLLLTATVSFALLLPSVLGEEIGWRGLLVPALSESLSFTQVCLLSGLLWSIWHWPLMFLGYYGNSETPLAYQLALFTVCIVAMSFMMTYFRYKTGSLWPAVIFHMSHNVFLQKFFSPITEENARSAWVMEEFGIAVPLVAACFAIGFWRKGVREFADTRG